MIQPTAAPGDEILRPPPAALETTLTRIEAIQQRLGTPQERPSDLQDVRDLVHEYANHLAHYILKRDLHLPPFLQMRQANRAPR